LKNKGFKEESMTKVRLYALGTSTTLESNKSVSCRYAPTFHFYATLTGMLGSTLIRDEIVQVGKPRQKRLLAAIWMMESLHREEFALDSVVGLIQQGAGPWHLGVCEDGIPACLLVLNPPPHALTVGRPCRGRDVVGKVA
jgi:hypothetical protein